MEDTFLITFDGGDADGHAIDMRLLGESLQGFDKMISDLVVIVAAKRLPKRGERAQLVVKAQEPKQGSVSIPAILQDGSTYLQLGWSIFGSNGSEMISNWIKGVLCFYGGKKDISEIAVERIAELAMAHTAAQDRVDERRHEEVMGLQNLLNAQVERLGPAAIQVVAPVGPSVHRLSFTSGEQPQVAVGVEEAETIREKGKYEFGPLQTYTLRTDGFTFHTRKLSVEHPERSGYLLAEVDDPVAEEENNPYAAAVQRKAMIRVQAKAGYRNGQLDRLVIMDFGGEIGEVA